MRPDEKKCPSCAETIKIDAAKCRFCGRSFSHKEISYAKYRDSASGEALGIDKAIAAVMKSDVDELYVMRDFKRRTVGEDIITQIAIESSYDPDRIARRLSALDIDVRRGEKINSAELSTKRAEWRQAQERLSSEPLTLQRAFDLMERYGQSWLTLELAEALATRLELKKESVVAEAKRRRFFYTPTNDGSLKLPADLRAKLGIRAISSRPQLRAKQQHDEQYGVLQPLANATSGCFAMWQWVILIFLIALLVVGVKSIFTG